MDKKIIIGTRGSELALWQARYTQQLLKDCGVLSELKIIVTSGDKNQQWENNFDKLEGKNFFTKEIEEALLKKEIDIAVHSFKDVEGAFEEDTESQLVIAGLSERHYANDILILHPSSVDKSRVLHIQKKARIGTSSARRYAQLKSLRSDIEILPLRGNVPTRIQKLKNHQYDGIILALAGVERLNIALDEFYVMPLPLHYFVPAAGQGMIAFQVHRDNKEILKIIKKISNQTSEECGKTERHLLKWVGGGCSKPIGVLCEKHQDIFRMYISFNTDKNLTSVLSIVESKTTESLINQAKQSVQNIQQLLFQPIEKKIFVSRYLKKDSYLKKIAERLHWKITDEPLIETRGIAADAISECDWIFFNSKNAVKYFLETAKENYFKKKKIACISDATYEYALQRGLRVDYKGEGNDLQSIAEKFSEMSRHQIVLFPCSNISNKSIGNYIESTAQCIYLPVYETTELSKRFSEEFDYLIFTSPSNVRAYFSCNKIKRGALLIAIGSSTKSELLKYGINEADILTPIAFDEMAIVGVMTGSINVK